MTLPELALDDALEDTLDDVLEEPLSDALEEPLSDALDDPLEGTLDDALLPDDAPLPAEDAGVKLSCPVASMGR
mgnify:CR=1 FL=1